MLDPFARPCASLFNLRDLGERPLAGGGRLPAGRVFRSAALVDPAAATDPTLLGLGLHTVIDLRTTAEAVRRPDQVPPGVGYRHLDVFAEASVSTKTSQAQLMSDPVGFVEASGPFDPTAQMHATYRQLVVGEAARAGFAALVRALLAADGAPVLIHCTAGKDRTGWAVTLLLMVAGVDLEQIRAEYTAVGPQVRQALAGLVARYVAAGAPPETITPMLEARPEYLDTALAQVEATFGGFTGYLREGLGLAVDEIAVLRALLTR